MSAGHSIVDSREDSSQEFPQAWSGVGRSLSGKTVEAYDVESASNHSGTTVLLDEDSRNNSEPVSTRISNAIKNASYNPDFFWRPNLPPTVSMRWYHYFFLFFSPCCLGSLCSNIRQRDFLRILTSIIFWLSLFETVVFLGEVIVNGGFVSISENPSIGPSTATLVLLGAKYVPLIKQKYELWRLITPIFLHAGILHLGFNMLFQLGIGLGYERQWTPDWKDDEDSNALVSLSHNPREMFRIIMIGTLGALKMGFVYFISGIGGVLLSCVWHPDTVSVGASGALMGIVGAQLVYLSCTQQWSSINIFSSFTNSNNTNNNNNDNISFNNRFRFQQWITVIAIIVVTFIFGFAPAIDMAGHIGGLFTGILLGGCIFSSQITKQQNQPEQNRPIRRSLVIVRWSVFVLSLFVLLVFFVILSLLLAFAIN